MGCGLKNHQDATGGIIKNPIFTWLANTVYFAILIAAVFFSGYFGVTAGDCGLSSAAEVTLFIMYAFMLFNGIFYLLFATGIIVILLSPFDANKLPLKAVPDFLRASKLGVLAAVFVLASCYILFRIIGTHTHCGISIGF